MYNTPLNWRDIGNGMMIQAKPEANKNAQHSVRKRRTLLKGDESWIELNEIKLTNQFPLKTGTQLLPGNINHDTVQKNPM